jgi:hypothetical protein
MERPDRRSSVFILSVLITAAAGLALAMPRTEARQQPHSEAPPAAVAGAATPASPATIDSLAFLAGTWAGEMHGSYVEETWSRPRGNNIVGSFRWLRPDGRPILFEILTITEEEAVLRLRLRHYSPTLAGKEERDKPMTLKLAESGPARVVFSAEKDAGDLAQIAYEVLDDVLTITVAFTQPDRDPLVFNLQRQP